MKRTKIINVRFTKDEWKEVCDQAELIEMKKSTFLRNMSLHKVWKTVDVENICLPLAKFNLIGSYLKQIINVAEKTKSEYLDELETLKYRFEKCRARLISYYSKLMNKEENYE